MGEIKELNREYLLKLLKELENERKDYIEGRKYNLQWFMTAYGIPMYNIKCIK